MYLKASFDTDFDSLMLHLESKYGKELFDIDGIGKQTDINEFSKQFFMTKSNVADVSVDSNANVDNKDMISYNVELPKAMFRINAYYLLWKKLRQLYGREDANRIIEMQLTGDIYINDFHGIQQPYCFNYSTYDIALEGLKMVHKIKSIAPKYLYSFKSQLEQFTMIASNSTLGATGLADMLMVMGYYIDNIFKNGHDAGFYFDGWFSDEEQKKITDKLKQIPVARSDGSTDGEIEKITKNINEKLEKTGPNNEEWFNFNVWRYVQENIVSFIYTINQPGRSGLQSPFTNVSIYDDVFLDKMIDDYAFVSGDDIQTPNKETVKKLQDVYLDVMNRELERTPITFPVTTACFAVKESGKDLDEGIQEKYNIKEYDINDRFIIDQEFVKFIAEKNLTWGFINIFTGESSSLASCCRLRSNLNDLNSNLIGGGSTKIGSLGVVTANFPRLAWKAESEEDFFNRLKDIVEDVAKINNSKRHIITKRIEQGKMPLYSLGYMDLSQQFLTFGVNGLNECLEILGYNILTEEGKDFALKIINTINEINDSMQKRYKGVSFNCEQTPSENSAIKLAKKDKLMKYNENEYELYSNQFIPLTTEANLLDRVYLQGVFDKHFSGGSIMHANVEQRLETVEQMEDLIYMCAEKGVIYWAVNYNLQECEEGHISVAKGDTCPTCGKPILYNYTRVVGFLTKTSSWANERREEDYPNRQFY